MKRIRTEMETESELPSTSATTPAVARFEGGLRELLITLPVYDIRKLFDLCNKNGQPLSVMTNTIINSHGKDPKKFLEDEMSECTLIYYLNQKGLSVDTYTAKSNLIQELLKFWEEGKHEKEDGINKGTGAAAGDALDSQGFTFAREFAQMFYSRLNSLTATTTTLTAEDFSEDCHFRVKQIPEQSQSQGSSGTTTTNNDPVITSFTQRQNVFNEMKKLTSTCHFQPSKLKLHYKSFANSQGVVLVLISGTVHQRSPAGLKGVFEQLFGLEKNQLISDGDNYKIKYSLLIVRDGKEYAKDLIQYMDMAEKKESIPTKQ